MTEDGMVEWHHRHNGRGFGWIPGVGDGQGGLVCCSSWGCKESDMTELKRHMGPPWVPVIKVSILYSWTNVRAGAIHLYAQEPHLRMEHREGR